MILILNVEYYFYISKFFKPKINVDKKVEDELVIRLVVDGVILTNIITSLLI
jgi:hypothetical protein